MIEREMLNSMFSLIVSKTIACVNKMRVNRFNRIENVRHVDKIHTFTNNIKILKSIQFHWIGFTKMAKHLHTHTRKQCQPIHTFSRCNYLGFRITYAKIVPLLYVTHTFMCEYVVSPKQ